VPLVAPFDGPIVDVGSGGGAPGIPLAHALPEREVVLLEAERRKCEFLERAAPPNARVVWGRAEEQGTDWAGVAVAKSAEPERVARVAERLAGELAESPDGFLVIRKVGPTPPGFPRRVGVAKKRPLA
jgi:16S rRNA (guanine527-N7)-methyltransferase